MAYTKKWNIIVVDWSRLSRLTYVKSREKIKDVGRILGEFIIFLKENNFVKLPRVHIIGHSLGSHIAGFAAQTVKAKYNQTVERISGLDPAAPGFEYGNRTNERNARLDNEDAKFVDIIHTNGRILGMLNPIGHVDFYPNGGVTQPGCNSYFSFLDYCSHVRACEFWTASIVHPDAYTGYRYRSWKEYLDQKFHDGKSFPMGIKASPLIPPGSYFLETASEIPYVHYKTKLIDSL
ncbi:pancreatic triacylglycerol lipase-like [Agrilus planipennis]|uniref:Pancreatic triacylglycerol lipase-like n=1 Tax=Agrilus planipennis TaxID=224129 RepID=A0A1W4XGB0_AGRPL|nr:pancreatic triacylglycerol lipase-like [Agrilus planipennis]